MRERTGLANIAAGNLVAVAVTDGLRTLTLPPILTALARMATGATLNENISLFISY
jgi:hypothetical protein